MRSPEFTNPKAGPKAELKRFLVDLPERVPECPATVTVSDEFVVHHLRTVMRAKPGEQMVMVDSRRELAYVGVLQTLGKRDLTLILETLLPAEANPLPPVIMAVALIKEQRWDLLLQKATELGVRAFQPLISERTVIRLSEADIPKKLERWQAVARSAAEQSEGLFIPQLLPPMIVAEFCADACSSESLRILLAERGENRLPLKKLLPTLQTGQSIVFAIGPEGGWTEGELSALIQAGFQSASLGQRIMRTETAGLAAMSAVVYELGMHS